uniref:Uncharacterized protein n=1 Tax=Dulem virus 40 TaxID=3145758 RepID=A0AAU8AX82_9CAUD
METNVLLPAHEMTTAQCVIECSGYLRTIANQEFEGEDWQTAPKYRRRNLLTDFLACIELTGEEFAELCGLIGFQLSKTTTAKLAKFTVIAYDWQGEANGEATADILAALNKCEGVTLIEQCGYRPQARTYDLLRFHIAAFWRCLVNELRSLCLGIGLVVYPKEIPAQATETPRIVRVEIVRDFDKSYYANLYGENGGCHNLSKEYTDFRTLKTLCKKEYGVNLPNLSQIEFETHGRKSYAYISTETPQISTETAKAENAPTEGAKREEISANCLYWDFLSQTIKERMCALTKVTEHLYYIDNGGKYVTLARFLNGVYWIEQCNAQYLRDAFDAARPEYNNILRGLNAYQTAEDFVAKYESRIENGCYLGEFDTELYKRITDITQTAETINVSVEGEKEAERAENKSKAERMKSKYDITEQLERIRVTFLSLPDWDLEPRLGRMALAEDICKRYLENINQHLGLYDETEFCRYSDLKIPQSVYAAPQSPETPQTVECTTDTPKPRETARKPQNRGIVNTRHSRLGANGYAMLDNASATLTAMHVPRECSTADAAYWQPRPNSLHWQTSHAIFMQDINPPHCTTGKKMRTKSKHDIAQQITRICKRHGSHRLYASALGIAIRYNAAISETIRNRRLYQLYMKCHYAFSGALIPCHKFTASRLLHAMEFSQYPASIYAKQTEV